MQEEYRRQLIEMVHELKELNPSFGIFINNWKLPLITQGGTVHTSVRDMQFASFTQDGVTMAQWLKDAVDGKVYDVGMELLEDKK